MISFKSQVDSRNINGNILLALMVADQVYAAMGLECVVTSLRDGKHRSGSRHYDGMAVDLRTRHLSGAVLTHDNFEQAKRDLAKRIGDRLPSGYHVAYEPTINGERTEHIHIEFRTYEATS